MAEGLLYIFILVVLIAVGYCCRNVLMHCFEKIFTPQGANMHLAYGGDPPVLPPKSSPTPVGDGQASKSKKKSTKKSQKETAKLVCLYRNEPKAIPTPDAPAVGRNGHKNLVAGTSRTEPKAKSLSNMRNGRAPPIQAHFAVIRHQLFCRLDILQLNQPKRTILRWQLTSRRKWLLMVKALYMSTDSTPATSKETEKGTPTKEAKAAGQSDTSSEATSTSTGSPRVTSEDTEQDFEHPRVSHVAT